MGLNFVQSNDRVLFIYMILMLLKNLTVAYEGVYNLYNLIIFKNTNIRYNLALIMFTYMHAIIFFMNKKLFADFIDAHV